LRISGSGLISLLSGMKPDTIVPGAIASGNGRAAIASAAACRASGGSASRRAIASRRSAALESFSRVDEVIARKKSAEPRWP